MKNCFIKIEAKLDGQNMQIEADIDGNLIPLSMLLAKAMNENEGFAAAVNAACRNRIMIKVMPEQMFANLLYQAINDKEEE